MSARTFFFLFLLTSSCLFSTQLRADSVRYDVSFNSENIGYMIFNDSGPVPGDIWPNVEDWSFSFNGFVFDTSNTVPWDAGYFAVDENYVFQSDLNGGAAPCFSSTGRCAGDPIAIGITRGLNVVVTVQPPESEEVYSGGSVAYSAPIFLATPPRSVPTMPGFAIALLVIVPVLVILRSQRRVIRN